MRLPHQSEAVHRQMDTQPARIRGLQVQLRRSIATTRDICAKCKCSADLINCNCYKGTSRKTGDCRISCIKAGGDTSKLCGADSQRVQVLIADSLRLGFLAQFQA